MTVLKQKIYDIYEGMVNYKGEIIESTKIAEFYSKTQAIEFVNKYNRNHAPMMRYGFVER